MALTLNPNRRSGSRQGFRKLAYQTEVWTKDHYLQLV